MATTDKLVRLDRLVANLGLCTRRGANAFLRSAVTVDGKPPPSQALRVHPSRVVIAGQSAVELSRPLSLALHKPPGFVASRVADKGSPSLFDLLPPEWARRRPALVLCGRLDKPVTGLVLLTQNGHTAHLATARGHEREYLITAERPLDDKAVALFASGTLMLQDETSPLLPADLRPSSDGLSASLVLREGRYHQVRRMLAAVGNRAVTIHRVRIGGISLGELGQGQHRVLTEAELASVTGKKH